MNTTQVAQADRRRALALRAFPPRWRERHGDELLHVSGELASSEEHVSAREFLDIVRGGLAVRIHDRPPVRVRFAYRWFEKPVPPQWHAWMRDDLRGRFKGHRHGLRILLRLWVLMLFASTDGGAFSRSQVVATGCLSLGVVVAIGPFQTRLIRKRMNKKVGYDIVGIGDVPPPIPATSPAVLLPVNRLPYVRYAVPLAVGSAISGTALIAGAAISNAPNRSAGPFHFSPDPNSPLTAQQVGIIALAVAIASIAVAIGVRFAVRARVRTLPSTTAHGSDRLSARTAWFIATVIGLPATVVGALGLMPDLACAVIGSVLVLSASANGIAALVVSRRDAELGRHISLAELLVGERVPAQHGVTESV